MLLAQDRDLQLCKVTCSSLIPMHMTQILEACAQSCKSDVDMCCNAAEGLLP